MTKKKTVSLVLGSGGARGYAHIGAIEMLEQRGYDIVSVSGCSMGALIGGIYAADKLTPFKDWATGLGQFDILKLLDFSLSSPGAIRGEKGFSIVRELLGDIRIEDLKIPYTAVATDLLRYKEIWFQSGSLQQAIRASVAIPSLLSPVLIKGRLLVDGGLLNPLPILPGISSHADLLIAVNLGWEEGRHIKLPVTNEEDKQLENWIEVFKEKTQGLLSRDTWDAVKKGLKI
jgi:NTE family protein